MPEQPGPVVLSETSRVSRGLVRGWWVGSDLYAVWTFKDDSYRPPYLTPEYDLDLGGRFLSADLEIG